MRRALTVLLFLLAVAAAAPACAAGGGQAEYEAGWRFETGEGGPLDYGRAYASYCRAARQGNAQAALRLAGLYFSGAGVGQDRGVAIGWARHAAELGNPAARKLLTRLKGASARAAVCRLPGEPPPLRGGGRPTPEILRLVREAALEYKVSPDLVLAVISVESGFQPDAVSPKNAQGLMQLMPDTAARFGVVHPFDPRENIRGGVRYLRWLLAYFRGNVSLAIAAYNAGEGAVDEHRGLPPYPETRAYVAQIRHLYRQPQHPFDAALTTPSPLLAELPGQ